MEKAVDMPGAREPVIISARNLSKSYRLYPTPVERLKEALHPFGKKYHREFKALDNVSFEIKKGESVGIIGRNGSGKSTLLQILCGVMPPTSGQVEVRGRVSALLELGAGFSPYFSGRENVYLNGAIMGLARKEMEERFDEIASFADIGDFIDQPVKTYSSGMFVRLAFACAVNVEPDILVVDEALAVGDKCFQLKCAKRIEELLSKGVTLFFVSHDSYTIKNICKKAVWLHEGKVHASGNAVEVVDRYNDFTNGLNHNMEEAADNGAADRGPGNRGLSEIKKVTIMNSKGAPSSEIKIFDDLNIFMEYEVYEYAGPLLIGASIFDNSGNYVFGSNTQLLDKEIVSQKGVHGINIRFPRMPLLPGTYHVNAGVFNKGRKAVELDFKRNVAAFYVNSPNFVGEGLVYLNTEWEQR